MKNIPAAQVAVVSRPTIVRLIKDIKEVSSDEDMRKHGIHYVHDMDNFLNGHAMVVGPEGTPYEDGLFFFHFAFPTDYPFAPPVVKFLPANTQVRFNPNLYTNGKVCLSVLNTWNGEPWSSCQTIRSILLTLVTVLNEMPLLNEPGIIETHADHAAYNRILAYCSIRDAFVGPIVREVERDAARQNEDRNDQGTNEKKMEKEQIEHEELFAGEIRAHWLNRHASVTRRICTLADNVPETIKKHQYREAPLQTQATGSTKEPAWLGEHLQTRCYGMSVRISWNAIARSCAECAPAKTKEKESKKKKGEKRLKRVAP